MNIRFLGTGFGPLKTKKRNTKDFRRPASLLIDDRILIDVTPQTLNFADEYALSDLYHNVRTILITATDSEHFSAETLITLANRGNTLYVYGDPCMLPYVPKHPFIVFQPIHTGEIFDVQEAKIIALPTVYRDENGNPAIGYAICTDRSLLYLASGGFLHPDAWDLLSKLHFDLAILGVPSADAPCGASTVQAANFELIKMLRAIFIDAKTLSDNARCFLTAIPTDRKRSTHEALLTLSADEGFTVAYDGLYLNI